MKNVIIHKMKLHKKPFEMIKDGSKTTELRLLDEKRQKIKVGDKIEFTQIDNSEEKLFTEVTGLLKYKSFEEMYQDIDYTKTGSTSQEDWKSMRNIYPKEKEEKYGVLGIELK